MRIFEKKVWNFKKLKEYFLVGTLLLESYYFNTLIFMSPKQFLMVI